MRYRSGIRVVRREFHAVKGGRRAKAETVNEDSKREVKNDVVRGVFVGLALLLQIGWLLFLMLKLYRWSVWAQLVMTLLMFVVVLYVLGKELNSAYKILWTIILLVFPVFGLLLFVLFGGSIGRRYTRNRFRDVDKTFEGILVQEERPLADLRAKSPVLANQARYLSSQAGSPLYDNTDVVFYADASEGFEAQLAAIEEAKSFVFMEYHAIEDSTSFGRLKRLLARKAAEGVEVRICYDHMGSIGFINKEFIAGMEALGIQCRVFNPLMPVLSVIMNNRDHRKITVVDGRVGFTGGYNLADEYFNLTHPYGEWKDTGVRLEGDAVRSLTITFLEMWNVMGDTDKGCYDAYLPKTAYTARERCWVQPYADSPLDGSLTGEDVYLNVIKSATTRLWATTPYLIIDDEMTRELTLAARRGVDVRIVTPGIPDKPFIYKMTRSYYAQLAKYGVRIFEWKPGFIHAKQMLADDQVGVVGTINLDYRSLYLHFENGVALYACAALADMARDFEQTFPQCEEVTEAYRDEKVGPLALGRRVLRLLAPLL